MKIVDDLRSEKMVVAFLTVIALLFMAASTAGERIVQASTEELLYSQEENGDLAYSASEWLISGNNVNKEISDDFYLDGIVTRVTVRGFSLGDAKNLQGFYIRFYDVAENGEPGDHLMEYFLSKENPYLSDNPAQPEQISIVLPTPFEATGTHFISVQAMTDSPWFWLRADNSTPNGASIFTRDVVTRGENNRWHNENGQLFNTAVDDLAFSLYGLVFTTENNPISSGRCRG
ncbi:MAG: hypothetical protein GY805_34705 [Chloroflexi bacterium]|nr:hypothetical protein [Chloroflexota bacterium]